MSLTQAVIGGGAMLGSLLSGSSAKRATNRAAGVAADAQTEALEYLKETEKVPQQYRTAGTEALGALYGLGTPEQNAAAVGNYQNSAISKIMNQNADASLRAGEQAIARNAVATGGIRGGDVQSSLYDYNTMFKNQQQQQMLAQYLQGLGGLSQTQTNPTSIANSISNIGATRAAGITGAAQAEQQGTANMLNILGTMGALFSDVRLKENIQIVGAVDGHNWYSWSWNELAESLGLSGESSGVIAQEVAETRPDVIGHNSGFLTVDYSQLLQ